MTTTTESTVTTGSQGSEVVHYIAKLSTPMHSRTLLNPWGAPAIVGLHEGNYRKLCAANADGHQRRARFVVAGERGREVSCQRCLKMGLQGAEKRLAEHNAYAASNMKMFAPARPEMQAIIAAWNVALSERNFRDNKASSDPMTARHLPEYARRLAAEMAAIPDQPGYLGK